MEEIGLVVLEIQKAEFGYFTVSVNNTLVCRTSSFVFLAADTLLCVLIAIAIGVWRKEKLPGLSIHAICRQVGIIISMQMQELEYLG